MQLLSMFAAIIEAHAPGARPLQHEKLLQLRSGPSSLKLEKDCAAVKTQWSQKENVAVPHYADCGSRMTHSYIHLPGVCLW